MGTMYTGQMCGQTGVTSKSNTGLRRVSLKQTLLEQKSTLSIVFFSNNPKFTYDMNLDYHYGMANNLQVIIPDIEFCLTEYKTNTTKYTL